MYAFLVPRNNWNKSISAKKILPVLFPHRQRKKQSGGGGGLGNLFLCTFLSGPPSAGWGGRNRALPLPTSTQGKEKKFFISQVEVKEEEEATLEKKSFEKREMSHSIKRGRRQGGKEEKKNSGEREKLKGKGRMHVLSYKHKQNRRNNQQVFDTLLMPQVPFFEASLQFLKKWPNYKYLARNRDFRKLPWGGGTTWFFFPPPRPPASSWPAWKSTRFYQT